MTAGPWEADGNGDGEGEGHGDETKYAYEGGVCCLID